MICRLENAVWIYWKFHRLCIIGKFSDGACACAASSSFPFYFTYSIAAFLLLPSGWGEMHRFEEKKRGAQEEAGCCRLCCCCYCQVRESSGVLASVDTLGLQSMPRRGPGMCGVVRRAPATAAPASAAVGSLALSSPSRRFSLWWIQLVNWFKSKTTLAWASSWVVSLIFLHCLFCIQIELLPGIGSWQRQSKKDFQVLRHLPQRSAGGRDFF